MVKDSLSSSESLADPEWMLSQTTTDNLLFSAHVRIIVFLFMLDRPVGVVVIDIADSAGGL